MKKSDKNKYIQAFSGLHSSVEINVEDLQKMNKTLHIRKRRLTILAATLCLLLAMTTVAFATDLFGLKYLALPQNLSDAIHADIIDDGIERNIISLQGYPDSPEYKALIEWETFLVSYDPENKLLTNEITPLGFKYRAYDVYTQEMADKLEEITAKYGLKCHYEFSVYDSTIDASYNPGNENQDNSFTNYLELEEFMDRISIGNLLGSRATILNGYVYEDGNFKIEGYLTGTEPGDVYDVTGDIISEERWPIDYSMFYVKKGTFNDVLSSIGNIADYKEWIFETKYGVEVCIAQSEDSTIIMPQLDDGYLTLSFEGSKAISSDEIEKIADSIDFTLVK